MAVTSSLAQPWSVTVAAASSTAAIVHSALYTGWVGHRRETPAVNEFRYQLFFLYLDLAELDLVFADRWFWSVEKLNWASFRRADHLRQPGPLTVAVRDEVQRQLGFRPAGPIRLLTHLRYLGYCFNPISIYYCFGVDGTTLEAIMPEIHNTPWGEEYVRALDTRTGPTDDRWHTYQLDKEFHVSPFMPMEISYTWGFTAPGKELGVVMENEHRGERIFTARLDLERQPLSGKNLALALCQWPCMTGKVIAAIYWQAWQLQRKGVPFCPHPEKLNVTKGTYRS